MVSLLDDLESALEERGDDLLALIKLRAQLKRLDAFEILEQVEIALERRIRVVLESLELVGKEDEYVLHDEEESETTKR